MSRNKSLNHLQCNKAGRSPFEVCAQDANEGGVTFHAGEFPPSFPEVLKAAGSRNPVNEVDNEDNSFDTG